MIGMICTQASLLSPEMQHWCEMFGRAGQLNRKVWEWAFISQALSEHGVLRPATVGLGFAVGGEPLVSLFAAKGAEIVATDLGIDEAERTGWANSSQHAHSLDGLNVVGLCDQDMFNTRVKFEFSDMNAIPSHFDNRFDFLWSSCALEHLGSLQHGIDFIMNSLKCLKRGGIAVHTTEFNVSSNSETIETGSTVLFRRSDIENLIINLKRAGYIANMNFDCGNAHNDYYVDLPPYGSDPHLKLMIQKYTVTSLGLVVVKI